MGSFFTHTSTIELDGKISTQNLKSAFTEELNRQGFKVYQSENRIHLRQTFSSALLRQRSIHIFGWGEIEIDHATRSIRYSLDWRKQLYILLGFYCILELVLYIEVGSQLPPLRLLYFLTMPVLVLSVMAWISLLFGKHRFRSLMKKTIQSASQFPMVYPSAIVIENVACSPDDGSAELNGCGSNREPFDIRLECPNDAFEKGTAQIYYNGLAIPKRSEEESTVLKLLETARMASAPGQDRSNVRELDEGVRYTIEDMINKVQSPYYLKESQDL